MYIDQGKYNSLLITLCFDLLHEYLILKDAIPTMYANWPMDRFYAQWVVNTPVHCFCLTPDRAKVYLCASCRNEGLWDHSGTLGKGGLSAKARKIRNGGKNHSDHINPLN